MTQVFNMLVGLPGSGKSTIAAEHRASGVAVHSSDEIREELFGNAAVQGDNDIVFRLLHRRITEDLQSGKSVTYDATNLNYRRRAEFLRQINKLGIQNLVKRCVLLATPVDICKERNRSRSRSVPDEAIDRMVRGFDPPTLHEGWDYINILSAPNADADVPDALTKALSLCNFDQDNPNHALSLGGHCIKAKEILLERYPDCASTVVRATLMHDFGKEYTKVYADAKGKKSPFAHYYGHENVGSYLSYQYTETLPLEQRIEIAALIRWHMQPFVIRKSQNMMKTEDTFIKRFSKEFLDKLKIMNECDISAL